MERKITLALITPSVKSSISVLRVFQGLFLCHFGVRKHGKNIVAMDLNDVDVIVAMTIKLTFSRRNLI